MAESICFLSVCVSLCQWANWLVCVFPWVCVCLCVFLLPLPGRWKTDAQPGKCRWAHWQTKSHVNTQASTLTLTQPGKRAASTLTDTKWHGSTVAVHSSLVAVSKVENVIRDTSLWLLFICDWQKVSRPHLFLEMFRACFMGLVDASNSSEGLKWATFTFLKVHLILCFF